MKTNKSIKALKIGINLILIFHLIMVLVVIKFANSAWNQTKIDSEKDLIGVEKLYYAVKFGIIDRSFEYIYESSDNSNPEKQLYTTGIAHLEPLDNNNTKIEIHNVTNKKSGMNINIPVNRLPLIIPVNHSQKKYFIFLATVFFTLIIMYSFVIFYQLKRFMKSVVSKKPFIIENIRILFSIGILVIMFPVLQYIVESIELSWIRNQYSFSGYSIHSDISFQFYLLGLGILILAITEVLRQGISLNKEHELTI